ncbi:hypothetical protein [Virgibacillus halodenitrificans]|nr:hypothetical protein [Virgibacillus halodenitrificans]WHX24501.1 hypothetical protein QNH47_09845 [Virgibacillus halodenitrificans]
MKKVLILIFVIGFVLVGCESETNEEITNEPNESDSENAII